MSVNDPPLIRLEADQWSAQGSLNAKLVLVAALELGIELIDFIQRTRIADSFDDRISRRLSSRR